MKGCSVDDPAALCALYDRHSIAVYRFISNLSGARDAEVDDLVGATFLEACRSASNFRGDSSVVTWLLGISVNVVRHHVRAAARRRAFLRAYRREPVPFRNLRPDETAENRELLVRLRSEIDRLPCALKETFVLCEIEGVPASDVASILRIPAGTLWRRIHQARMILRRAVT